MRENYKQGIAHYSQDQQKELLARFDARMRAGIEAQERVARQGGGPEQIKVAVNSRMADVDAALKTPAPAGSPQAMPVPTDSTPSM
ncbi:hypothetical protein D3C81_1796540 [compost metagenome]